MFRLAIATIVILLLVWLGHEIYKRWKKYEAQEELDQARHDAEAKRLRDQAKRERMGIRERE